MMFITKKKLEALTEKARMEANERYAANIREADLRHEMERMERNLWERMNMMDREINQRIDRLADLTIPQEEKKPECPFCPPVRRV